MAERSDRPEYLILLGASPRLVQLGAPSARPTNDGPASAGWKPTVHDLDLVDFYLGAVFAVPRMEVRSRVIVEVHRDDDATKAAKLRHLRAARPPAA